MSITIGLDIGTTSVSAVALDAAGELLGQTTLPHQAAINDLPADYAEQSLELITRTARQSLSELTATLPEAPACLGLTGQMHGVVLLDRHRSPLTNLITWQDRRAAQAAYEQKTSPLEQLNSRLPADIADRLGCQIRPGYAIATVAALRNSNRFRQATTQLVDITGWIGAQLTGAKPCIDPTFAASWGLFDLRHSQQHHTLQFCQPVLDAADIDAAILPQLQPSGSVLGTVTSTAATQWSLQEGLPVLVGLGDHQAAVFAALPKHATNTVHINVGTGGQIAWQHPNRQPSAEIEIRPFLDGQLLQVGAGLAGGDAYSWLVKQVQQWLNTFGYPCEESSIHKVLATACQTVDPAQNPLQCVPFFTGTRTNPDQRGTFTNIDAHNFSLGQIAHAVLAGIVDNLCGLYESAPNRLDRLEHVTVSGNFFEHHRWTIQRIAQRWQVPVESPAIREQAACGAAKLASRYVNPDNRRGES